MTKTPPNPYRPNPVISAEEVAVSEKPVVRPLWSLALWHLLVFIAASKLFFVVIPIFSALTIENNGAASSVMIFDRHPLNFLGIFLIAQMAMFLFCISRETIDSDPYQDLARRRWSLVALFAILVAVLAAVVAPYLMTVAI